jgi:ATP-binding cassette subfamily F protein 3
MVKISNLSLSFGDKVIFDDLNWIISDSNRIALVGVNGAGKTTLLKSIKGLFDFYHGKIEVNRDSKIGYLPQDMIDIVNMPLIEYFKLKSGYLELINSIKDHEASISKLDHESKEYREISRKYDNAYKNFEVNYGYEFENKIKLTLEGLGFKKTEYEKDTSFFSGGWKMRIILAEIILSNPDLMLLDEPTNHLDTESMEYFEDFLRSYKKTFIAISHDRMFLDKMVDQIAELERGKITLFNGTYSEYLVDKELKIEELKKQQKLQMDKIKKTQVFIDKFRYKATKAVQVQSRIKMLEKIELIEIDSAQKHVNIFFPDCRRSAYEVIKVENVTKHYNSNMVLDNLNLEINRGDKIALVGVNGAGKSTFSRLISRVESPTSGTIKIGSDVSIGFFAQESSKNLNYENTVWEEINSIDSKAKDQEKRDLLGAFLFSNDDIYKKINVISGGEKSRLALCKLLLQEYNLLILDEPTNHLDITTKEIFQDALKLQ